MAIYKDIFLFYLLTNLGLWSRLYNMEKKKIIQEIAKKELGLLTLDTRNSDALDFHDLSVWSIKAALEKAYEAGKNVNVKKKTFYIQDNIGTVKYTVNYHDGIKKNRDGSNFSDLATFKNKKKRDIFVKDLLKKGYIETGIYGNL